VVGGMRTEPLGMAPLGAVPNTRPDSRTRDSRSDLAMPRREGGRFVVGVGAGREASGERADRDGARASPVRIVRAGRGRSKIAA